MSLNRYALLVMEISARYLAEKEPNPSPGNWLDLKSSRSGGDRASNINLLREAHATLRRDGRTADGSASESPVPVKRANENPG
ncbi:MAG TPA: hypothetical protein VLC55_08335 [Burkholderiales bacterium]|nr:hypothetical protein [Burkholderiales bacterium]